MDIWNWVEKLRADLREAGQEQSARLIDELTAYVCDLEVERAEALLPEVKALSRTLNNPWLEIFVRHWEMRNRVGNQRPPWPTPFPCSNWPTATTPRPARSRSA